MLRAESALFLIRERVVAVLVPDLDGAAEAATAAARDAGGSLQTRNGGQLVFAIPEARAGEFARRVALLGEVQRESGSSEDVAFRAADLESAARAARARRAELEQLRARAASASDGLLVEQRIAQIDAALATAERELRLLRQQALRVKFVVELLEKPVEPLPTVNLPFPWLATLSGQDLAYPSRPEPEADSEPGIASNVDMSLSLEGRRLADRPAPDEDSRALLLALRLRAARTDPVGIAAGYDASLGGFDGFVYEFRGFLGLGTAAGNWFTLGLLGGVGVSGWTGDRVPISLELPVELFTLIDLGAVGRLSMFAQPRWALTSEARRAGTGPGEIAHEYTLGGAVLLPFVFGNDDVDEGGLRLGFEYGEVLESPVYSVNVGIGFGFLGH